MKILGSYVGTCEDIKKRKTLATLAMNRLNPIWKSWISVKKKESIKLMFSQFSYMAAVLGQTLKASEAQ